MFLRKNIREKDGKSHVYWTLVETYRTLHGPRQRIVSYLGELNEGQQTGYRGLGDKLTNGEPRSVQQELFEVIKPGELIKVYPEKIRVERVRDFGDVWLGVSLWKVLQLDQFFNERIEVGREQVSWADMICYVAVSRFSEPTSELAIAERLSQRHALCDILGIAEWRVEDNRLYRTLDQLLPLKDTLTQHLKKRYGELFGIEYDIMLYDITSTYFEGTAELNPQAAYGYSRDKRSDCKQVLVALVVTKEGFPLTYEVFAGNRRDVTTVKEIVQGIEAKYGKARRVWVMDRGMVSEEILAWLSERGDGYLVGTPRSMLKDFEAQLTDKGWQEAEPGVEVKFAASPYGTKELFVICRSAARAEKERAMLNRFMARIEEGLKDLATATQRANRPLSDRDTLQRKIGALLKTNARAARFFEVKVESVKDENKTRLHLSWTKKERLNDWAEISCGHYLLRANISDELSQAELWKAYMDLTKVEDNFRVCKSDLGLRPIWHHKENRVQAHIFVCFLALVLQRVLEAALDRAGLGRSPRKVIEEFRAVKSMDLILPTDSGTELKMRVVSEPEPSLKILMQHCKILIPKRLTKHPAHLSLS